MKDGQEGSGFARRLKYLRTTKGLTQKETAEHLGIGQSAVANYEQGLRFPDEAILKGLSGLFDVSIDFLLGNRRRSSGPPVDKPGELPTLYRNMLLEHRKGEALDLLSGAIGSGTNLSYLYGRVLLPTLRDIGHLWEKGTLTVAEEHVLSAEIERTVGILAFLTGKSISSEKRCVCATVGAEEHRIGARMVCELLASEGWNTWYLGIQTPTRDIAELCSSVQADLLVLSATIDSHLEAAGMVCTAVRADNTLKNCRIAVGGAAFDRNPEAWITLGADAYWPEASTAPAEASSLMEAQNPSPDLAPADG